jgi:hypothetical protein
MPLFRLSSDTITSLERGTFAALGIQERGDLQRLLRDNVSVIAPNTLVISEEFSNWDRSDRRIDLLGVDKQARLVVIELKRTTDDSFADLQALRYAAMVSQMTFDEAVDTYQHYLSARSIERNARSHLLDFLEWTEPGEGRFNEYVRIVLAAGDFSPEVTSTVLWLNQRDLDVVCVRLHPYRLGTEILLDVQQIIPLPEAADYQVQIRQKQRENRQVAEQTSDWTRYDVWTKDELHPSLYKREAIYTAVRFLIENGVKPTELEALAGRHLFESLDGEVSGEAFRSELVRRRSNNPTVVKRYYAGDDELLTADGRTYAVHNQWTKATMEAVMNAFVNRYGSLGLRYSVASSNQG